MMDWTRLGDETVDVLRRYLMLDTTNPPGNETAGARFLFGPFVLDDEERRRIHGNDERISLENLREGVRCYTEMLLAAAGA